MTIHVLTDSDLALATGGQIRLPLSVYLEVVGGAGSGPGGGGKAPVTLPPSADRYLKLVRKGVEDVVRDHRRTRP
jgi:hypothetical protein